MAEHEDNAQERGLAADCGIREDGSVELISQDHMRLFVWEGFCPDYTDGLAFAIARNIEEAKKLVIESKGYTPFDWGTVREFPVTEPRAFCVSGGG